jgi:hypothetical protein
MAFFMLELVISKCKFCISASEMQGPFPKRYVRGTAPTLKEKLTQEIRKTERTGQKKRAALCAAPLWLHSEIDFSY